MQTAERLWI